MRSGRRTGSYDGARRAGASGEGHRGREGRRPERNPRHSRHVRPRVSRAAAALQGYEGFAREWESDADKLTLLYLSRIGIKSEGYPNSIETFLPPVAAAPIPYWEPTAGRETPLAKRLDQVRSEVSSMGLDAGLPCEQARWAPVRARLGVAP
jgi:hypothetical protein